MKRIRQNLDVSTDIARKGSYTLFSVPQEVIKPFPRRQLTVKPTQPILSVSNTCSTERPIIKKYLVEKKCTNKKRLGQIIDTVGFFSKPGYTKLSKSKTFAVKEVKENDEPSPKYKKTSVLPGFYNNSK